MNFIPGQKLIIVDIQPAYQDSCNYFMDDFIESIANFEGQILYLYNGENMGFEDEDQLRSWLIDKAMFLYEDQNEYNEDTDEYSQSPQLLKFIEKLDEINFVEKEYGFIRDTLDAGYKEDTLEIVKYLLSNDITDIRDVPEEDLEQLNIDEKLKNDLLKENLSITLPSFDHNILINWNRATLIGGGRNECLLEIEIMMKAMNLQYSTFDEFIYD